MPRFVSTGPRYMVEIVAFDDDRVEKTMGPFSEGHAEKIQRAADINLDHERFYTVTRRARPDEYKEAP